MIVCAQPFFNETDLLEIKCRELEGVVDLHVVVEADLTFAGQRKPLYFAENKARFAQWPIHHVVAELQPVVKSPWERERRQHEFLREAVAKLKPEIAIYCDLDEIPRADTVERFRHSKKTAMHVDMDWILFFFDRLDTTRRPTTARICYPGPWTSPLDPWGPWRGDNLDKNPATVLPDAGWHFDYFNFSPDFLTDKLKATSHSADESGDSMLREVERGGLPGFERTVPYPREKLPRYVRENAVRWGKHFYESTPEEVKTVLRYRFMQRLAPADEGGKRHLLNIESSQELAELFVMAMEMNHSETAWVIHDILYARAKIQSGIPVSAK